MAKPKFTQFVEDNVEKVSPPPLKFPGGILTNLDIEGRKPLPEVKDARYRSQLHEIVEYAPETYAEYIILLQQGAYYNSAAESIGIPEKTLAEWGKKGRRDLDSGIDSVYSRFTLDVRKSIAKARVRCEIQIHQTDPRKWLSLGPGRIFGNQWAEEKTHEPEPEVIEMELKETLKLEHVDTGMTVANIDPKTELETIEALEAAGQGQWPESHKEALRKQIQDKQ